MVRMMGGGQGCDDLSIVRRSSSTLVHDHIINDIVKEIENRCKALFLLSL